MPAKVATRDLTREVDGRRILDRIDLDVAAGEMLAVVGPSGAGKTSLLRVVVRLDEPTSGTVLLDGTDTRKIPPRRLRRRVGLVPQSAGLWDGTVADNVALGPRLRDEPVDGARVEELLARVGMEGFAGRRVDDLSGGEAQRVALARTLMNDPGVVLMDEPTASLDPATEAAVEDLLGEVLADRTAVVVTHDRSQARRLGDRVALLRDGRIRRTGPPGEVLA